IRRGRESAQGNRHVGGLGQAHRVVAGLRAEEIEILHCLWLCPRGGREACRSQQQVRVVFVVGIVLERLFVRAQRLPRLGERFVNFAQQTPIGGLEPPRRGLLRRAPVPQ